MYQIRDCDMNRVLETGRHSPTIKAAMDALYDLMSPELECTRDEFNIDDVQFFGYNIESEDEND